MDDFIVEDMDLRIQKLGGVKRKLEEMVTGATMPGDPAIEQLMLEKAAILKDLKTADVDLSRRIKRLSSVLAPGQPEPRTDRAPTGITGVAFKVGM